MCKGNFFCVQEKPAERADCISHINVGDGVVAALVVDLVADDRMVDIGHVDAYLVGAAGFDLDVEQCEFVESLSNGPKCQGAAAMGCDLHP